FGRSNRWCLPARRMRAHSRFRARQNPGSARDALSIPPGKITDQFPDLYWRSQFGDDGDLRSSRARKPAPVAAPAIDGGSCAVCFKWSDHSGRAGASRTHLCAFQRNDGAKTLSNIFARRIIGNPRSSIFFVGYADPQSPAGILRATQPGAEVTLDPDEPAQRVRCHIEQFQFSAHAPREALIAY